MDSFIPPFLNIAKLRRKIDITDLTFLIYAENYYKNGRFYFLWRVFIQNGNFIVIQAEPWWRPGPDFVPDTKSAGFVLSTRRFLEEHRAVTYLLEVIQTMLDSIVIDGEHNWAYLVHLPKENTYRLVYKKRRLIHDCQIWTKVVELDDIELTRFVSGLCWEGIYEGQDVDLYIAWQDNWGYNLSAESQGLKLVESRGLGRYFFELKAHISKNGEIIGIMMEAIVGRCVKPTDRSAVYEAVADILRQRVTFVFQITDIYITDRGVRFASASSAEHHRDSDKLAEEAEFMWKILAEIFDHMDQNPLRGLLMGSRSMPAQHTAIIPRLPSPRRPLALSSEEAIIRWVWSTFTSAEFSLRHAEAFMKLYVLYCPSDHPAIRTRRGKRNKGDIKALLPSDDGLDDDTVRRVESVDRPLAVSPGAVARMHPYARPSSKRLLLSPE